MNTYPLEDFIDFFCKQEDKSKSILIHSSIANLGIPSISNTKIAPHKILDCYLDIFLKSKCEILMPTFNYKFPESRFVDLRILPSEVGSLTEAFRKNVSFRSTHPMFSFASNTGDSMVDNTEYNPFFGDCVYKRLLNKNATMMFLGIDIRVCTFMMFAEANIGVKYRYFKPFLGTIIDMLGNKQNGEFYHFCLPPTGEIQVDYSRALKILIEKNIIKTKKLGSSCIYYFEAQDFYNAIKLEVSRDPFMLLKESPKRFWTYCNGEDCIIN